jgi:predicted double-glycine peptidase
MNRGASLGILLLSLLAAGCAISPNSTIQEFADSSGSNSFEVFDRELTSSSALVLDVRHDRQRAGPSCGAHVLASVVNYWRGPGTLEGDALFRAHPPAHEMGYSMSEVMALARAQGLLASAVRMPREGIISELEAGRPVLVPVRLPSIYVQQRVLPGGDIPVVGIARNALIYRAGRVSEFSNLALVNHYLLVVGYDEDRFVVIEPVMGYRTISVDKLERYRRAFQDAAIVFSAPQGAAAAGARTAS